VRKEVSYLSLKAGASCFHDQTRSLPSRVTKALVYTRRPRAPRVLVSVFAWSPLELSESPLGRGFGSFINNEG